MSAPLNGFNKVAHVYDLLVRIVFGADMEKAQQRFLSEIAQGADVLVIGGGTGKFMEHLFEVNPLCSVDYVEASSSMIARAQAGIPSPFRNRVDFIHGTQADIPARKYEAVITYFFLDVLAPESFTWTVTRLHAALKSDGVWLVSDFTPARRWWQVIMLKVMYIFFRTTTGIKAKSLPPWEDELLAHGMARERGQSFFGNFIETAVFRKVTEKR